MGYVSALAAALFFGANGSVTKVLLEAGLTPAQLTVFRVLATSIICAAILLVRDRHAFRVAPRQLAILAFLGIVGVAMLQFTYAVALGLLPVGITLLIEYTAVLLVAVIAFFVFRERVKRRLWAAIACVLVGLAIVARIWAGDLDPVGVLFAFGAATSLTIYFVVGEREVGKTSPIAVGFWTMAFASAFWLVFGGWWRIDPALFAAQVSLGGNLEAVTVPFWTALLWSMVLGSFVPFALSLVALRHLTATAAGIVASAEVIFAFLVAWLWLDERLTGVQLLGAAVVLTGIVLAQTARAGKVVDADLALAPSLTRTDVGPPP